MEAQSAQSAIQSIALIVQIASLLFLIIYVVKTWEMASATRKAAEATEKSVSEMHQARDEESAPYVIVYFEIPPPENIIYLVVKNIGRTTASAVHMTFDPELRTSDDRPMHQLEMVRQGIASMPPGYELRTLFDVAPQYFSNAELPTVYSATIEYFGGLAQGRRSYETVLDLNVHRGLAYISRKGMNDLVNDVGEIKRHQKDITSSLDEISASISRGLGLGDPYVSTLPTFTDQGTWQSALQVKIREFALLWQVGFAEQRLQGMGLRRLQALCGRTSMYILALVASSPHEPAQQLRSRVVAFARALAKLSAIRFYIDGGASLREFNEGGDAAIASIADLVPLPSIDA